MYINQREGYIRTVTVRLAPASDDGKFCPLTDLVLKVVTMHLVEANSTFSGTHVTSPILETIGLLRSEIASFDNFWQPKVPTLEAGRRLPKQKAGDT